MADSASSTYTITPSGSSGWSTNEWSWYSFVDVTQGWGYELAANNSTSITTSFTGSNYGVHVPAPGDSYQILRTTVCLDQPARGAGLLVTGSASNPVLASTGSAGYVNEVLDPIYEFADVLPSTANHTVVSDTGIIVANRDYYAESINQSAQTSPTSPFNGTSGTGHGTLANRPSTCTMGVGYWATDQGNWNQSGNGFGQGQLFVCTATNTWTLYYTPYTYPHPLAQSAPLSSPTAPTNLVTVVQ